MANNISKESKEILAALAKNKNVLLTGTPATGKSRILNEIAEAFVNIQSYVQLVQPQVSATSAIPIPRTLQVGSEKIFPSPQKVNRKVFRTTFHQNTKYREFITGLVPVVGGTGQYEVMEGILYRASEFAKQPNSAALLIIDEINRGTAIEIFGGSIVAMEPDKRLDDNNNETVNTQKFELLNKSGQMEEYAFPSNLYIIGAMNSADASIAPLDVAFLRRWNTYRLHPDSDLLDKIFGITDKSIKDIPVTVQDVYNVAVRAWEKINQRISIGRGDDYQIGHGIFLVFHTTNASNIDEAKEEIANVWPYILTHIEECFWGDTSSICAVLNIDDTNKKHPFKVETSLFAGEEHSNIKFEDISFTNIYNLFLAIIGD